MTLFKRYTLANSAHFDEELTEQDFLINHQDSASIKFIRTHLLKPDGVDQVVAALDQAVKSVVLEVKAASDEATLTEADSLKKAKVLLKYSSQAFASFSMQLSLLVTASIVQEQSATKREVLISQWLKVAVKLQHAGNFHALDAVLAALNSGALYHLAKDASFGVHNQAIKDMLIAESKAREAAYSQELNPATRTGAELPNHYFRLYNKSLFDRIEKIKDFSNQLVELKPETFSDPDAYQKTKKGLEQRIELNQQYLNRLITLFTAHHDQTSQLSEPPSSLSMRIKAISTHTLTQAQNDDLLYALELRAKQLLKGGVVSLTAEDRLHHAKLENSFLRYLVKDLKLKHKTRLTQRDDTYAQISVINQSLYLPEPLSNDALQARLSVLGINLTPAELTLVGIENERLRLENKGLSAQFVPRFHEIYTSMPAAEGSIALKSQYMAAIKGLSRSEMYFIIQQFAEQHPHSNLHQAYVHVTQALPTSHQVVDGPQLSGVVITDMFDLDLPQVKMSVSTLSLTDSELSSTRDGDLSPYKMPPDDDILEAEASLGHPEDHLLEHRQHLSTNEAAILHHLHDEQDLTTRA